MQPAAKTVFHAVTIQLINGPATSLEYLERASRFLEAESEDSAVPAHLRSYAGAVESWAESVLVEEFRPPSGTVFFPFKMEGGLCDVVRAAYSIGGDLIQVASTRHLLSVTLKPCESPSKAASRLDRATSAALRILAIEDPARRLALVESGEVAAGIFGGQDFDRIEPIDPSWPDWLDVVSWWVSGDRLGFVTLKLAGGPQRELVSAALEDNRHWFPEPPRDVNSPTGKAS